MGTTKLKKIASAGNRTRAARVAGEHSTTEPPMRVQNVYSPAGNTTYSEVTGTDGNKRKKLIASAGNRTRAARVAGEHSTTEPPMRVQNVYSPAGNTTYSEVTGTDGNNIRNSRIKHCIGRESNPGRPRGRRAFYH
ncbi:hypothetical protein RB195_012306 [Necator americanus]|uniref:Uncharacterized protein n=1 Tax=Necator americanus TaxID=51031 RepID=A0ABR1D7P9_NECAM